MEASAFAFILSIARSASEVTPIKSVTAFTIDIIASPIPARPGTNLTINLDILSKF